MHNLLSWFIHHENFIAIGKTDPLTDLKKLKVAQKLLLIIDYTEAAERRPMDYRDDGARSFLFSVYSVV